MSASILEIQSGKIHRSAFLHNEFADVAANDSASIGKFGVYSLAS
jgi:hypothetical protein